MRNILCLLFPAAITVDLAAQIVSMDITGQPQEARPAAIQLPQKEKFCLAEVHLQRAGTAWSELGFTAFNACKTRLRHIRIISIRCTEHPKYAAFTAYTRVFTVHLCRDTHFQLLKRSFQASLLRIIEIIRPFLARNKVVSADVSDTAGAIVIGNAVHKSVNAVIRIIGLRSRARYCSAIFQRTPVLHRSVA